MSSTHDRMTRTMAVALAAAALVVPAAYSGEPLQASEVSARAELERAEAMNRLVPSDNPWGAALPADLTKQAIVPAAQSGEIPQASEVSARAELERAEAMNRLVPSDNPWGAALPADPTEQPSSGIDWRDAGMGASVGAALVLLGLGAALAIGQGRWAKLRTPRSGPHSRARDDRQWQLHL
jgi:hypothetical protein